ncbi:MAG TPA: hypothetical protein VMV69_30660 [Pirellulales bacterium]|nr:hypothetical protein [Pirellulales bacterium]
MGTRKTAASLKDKGPVDDEAWDLAAVQAACLNEMSYLLMDDGTMNNPG